MLQIFDKLYNFTTNKCTICEDYCQSICLNIVTACFRSSCFVVAVRECCSVSDSFLPISNEYYTDGSVALRSGRTISQRGTECGCALSAIGIGDSYIHICIGSWLYSYGVAKKTCDGLLSLPYGDTLCADAAYYGHSARLAQQQWCKVALSALPRGSAVGAFSGLLGCAR